MGFGSNVNKGKLPAYDLNAEHDDEQFGSECPICFEPMVNKDNHRTIVKLQCDHTFHLGRNGAELCPYIEYTSTFPRSSVVVGDTSSRVVPNPSLHADQLHHPSNPSHLIPISPLPSNPRIFQNVSNPEVTRARHYFAHPFIDHSSIGSGTSTANAPLFPPNQSGSVVGDAPIVQPYLGGNFATSSVMDNAQLAWLYLAANLQDNALLANPTIARPYPVVPPLIGGLPTPAWPTLMFPFGWGQLPRGIPDFWSTPSGLNHLMYGGGGINNMASGSGSSGRGSSGVGESHIDNSGGSGRSGESGEDGSNGGGESSNSRGEHGSQGPS
ncbi:unnamed protein product [Microthlaspi erraticum]|uniref:Uncharacterized protein n=1 Tax=Microthlaspi erraticum TaxID=1685480 RepID=A0A6D2JPQ0_9BRAS|nr:unnamed protein product [Microthlaspi erraticum]